MTSVKPPTGNVPTGAGGTPGDGSSMNEGAGAQGDGVIKNLGSPNSGNIAETEFPVLKQAVAQGNEDTKNILEHVKGDSSGGSLDDVHLQDSVQRQSSPQNLESNILKKMSDTSGSLISNFGDAGGGGAGKPGGEAGDGARGRRLGIGILAALLLLLGLFVGIRFFAPWDQTVPNTGAPDLAAANPGPPELPGQPNQYPPNPCAMRFEKPEDAAGIPPQGPLDVQWSELPGAASYEFRVMPPAGAGDPWVMPTDGTSRKIYMENFPAAGQYKFALSALDKNGAAMCSIELTFDKLAVDEAHRQKQDSEGGGGAGGCYSMVAC